MSIAETVPSDSCLHHHTPAYTTLKTLLSGARASSERVAFLDGKRGSPAHLKADHAYRQHGPKSCVDFEPCEHADELTAGNVMGPAKFVGAGLARRWGF